MTDEEKAHYEALAERLEGLAFRYQTAKRPDATPDDDGVVIDILEAAQFVRDRIQGHD